MHGKYYKTLILFFIFISQQSVVFSYDQKDTVLITAEDTINKGDTYHATGDTIRIDTLKLDTAISDTIILDTASIHTTPKDTISPEIPEQDTGKTILKDTLSIRTDTVQAKADSSAMSRLKDSIPLGRDTTMIPDSIQKEKDTLVLLTKADSAMHYINEYTSKDTIQYITDTVKKHITKLFHYIKSQPIDSTIDFLGNYLKKDTLMEIYSDSLLTSPADSFLTYMNYLLDSARTDSVRLWVVTEKKDSIPFWLYKKPPKDSSRMVLFDDLDNPAGLWLIPKREKGLKIKLDENTLIEKTGFRERIEEDLPTQMIEHQLQEYKGIEMIFPEWNIGGVANLNFNQGYVKNWIKGGESSLSTLLDINFNADYKKGKTIWDNDAEYKFGILQTGEKGLRKNEDIFEVNSKFGSNATNEWYYSALVNFTTQLFKGYDYPNDSVAVSGLLSPAYLVFSLGMDYKPGEDLTLLLSPISSKITMMRDTTKFDQTKYGIPKNQKSRKELGAYIKSIYNFNINEDIEVQNKINLFTNYLEKPQNIDIDWEVTVKMKITEIINTTISTHLIYDDDVDFPVYKTIEGEKTQVGTTKKLQFKELLSVGITYQF
jgi:hypothetical protein